MRNAWLLLLALTAALILWLFAPALTGASSFAFRDAAHFYHPLFEYLRGEWGAGRVPLWNPYENLGTPLLAENTSSVFYPGKLLFALPLDYTWLYNLYIIGHVALAAATAWRLARHLRASTLGVVLGALSYAFSGCVLFQHCNVIFLVGAAWLPLALLYADRMLRQRDPWAIVGFGVVVALIVLGGDPHLAYNIGLASAGYALLLWWNERQRRSNPIVAKGRGASTARTTLRLPWRLIYLGLGSLAAALLASVQLLPSLEASPYGERSHYEAPRNVYEYARELATSSESVPYERLLKIPSRGHQSHIYSFSLAPWRAIEMIWPNVTGRQFPTHRRWLLAAGAEDTLWLPSLYFGLLPLAIALGTFSLKRRAPVEVRGLSWLVVLAALGSFGSYGIGYLTRSLIGTEDLPVGDEAGGLYWWFVTLLPGYVQFRYPLKLFVLTSLGLSMLAARGWRTAWLSSRQVLWLLAAVPVLSLAAGIAIEIVWQQYQVQLIDRAKPTFQGPIDWDGAFSDAFDGLLHGGLLALVLAGLIWFARRDSRDRRMLQVAALAVTALDLAVAQQHLLDFAPSELWTRKIAFLQEHPEFANRVYRQPSLIPPSFGLVRSEQRYAEAIALDRETLAPKYPLPLHIRVMPAAQSVAGADLEQLLNAARLYSRRMRGYNLPEPSVLDMLNVQTLIVGERDLDALTGGRRIAEGVFMAGRATVMPRAWIVHQVEVRPPFHSRSEQATREFTRELMFPDNQPRDWRRVAVVETDEAVSLPAAETAEVPAGESCTIERDEPLVVEIRATLKTPGLVILADQFFPGWELTVESAGSSKRQPILRTNRVLRGVVLPPGEHRLVYRYQPKSFYAGAILSSLAVASVAGASAFRWRQTSRTTRRVKRPLG